MRSLHPSVRPFVFAALLLGLAGCSGSERPDPGPGGSGGSGTDGGTRPPPLGADTRGDPCVAACGADDDQLCTSQSEACLLCLVDPAHVRLTYCSQDCSTDPCPEGWTCAPIKAFGQPQVERACVAEAARCGDGVVQLGEVCDGDEPELGRCVDCMGFEAVCGDGVVQLGEVCDGDVPELGRCVDCMRWEAICGDGFVQAPEVCDGDADGKYCITCGALEAPRVELNIRDFWATGVERDEGNMRWFYGIGTQDDALTVVLPTAGDADGCGAMEVLGTSETSTRLAWTLCSDWGISTWRFVLPRTEVNYRDFEGPIPGEFDVSVRVRARDGSYEAEWTMQHLQSFQVRAFSIETPAWAQGILQFRLSQPDPLVGSSRAEALVDLNYRLLHPMR